VTPVHELEVDEPAPGLLVRPDEPTGVGVLLMAGSSGRIDDQTARFLGRHGAHVLALRYFGGPRQLPGICELPLETFAAGLDRLEQEPVERLVMMGLSKGAEAALLLAVRDPRPHLVVAQAPTPWVWANVGPGADGETRPARSSWTWRGEPLPFIPYDDSWEPPEPEPPYSFVGQYRQSLNTYAAARDAARIPVEQIAADLVLVAGGDDQVWPSVDFGEEITRTRRRHGRETVVVTVAEAGHTPIFPGTEPPPPSAHLVRGGTEAADRELGAAAWDRLRSLL
jgi:dienelactone hydrolase